MLVIALVSRTALPVWVPTGQVFSHKLGVFATDRSGHLSLLSSTLHTLWAWKRSSTMKADLNYSPSNVYDTFPQPKLTDRMDRVGEELHSFAGR
ncbi:MAG: type IIL restriction-modification enzyme MmeI [Gammaproteobacteria bacterium]